MTEVEPSVTRKPASKAPARRNTQTVTAVKHYTDRLFSFRVTRPQSLRFRSGEFVMLGLPDQSGKPLLRAYSIASPSWEDELEFYSIKVPDGPLTSRLQLIQPGDEIILSPKPVGTLVHDALLPGERLWFFATGTGIAPFASLLREPETYQNYEQIILTHTCRYCADLEYGRNVLDDIRQNELLAEVIHPGFADKITYFPTTTRDRSARTGRITELLGDGTVFRDLHISGLDPGTDRAMICGSLGFNKDMQAILDSYGLHEGANSEPREYVVEKAFVG